MRTKIIPHLAWLLILLLVCAAIMVVSARQTVLAAIGAGGAGSEVLAREPADPPAVPPATALLSPVTDNDVGTASFARPERTFLPGAAPGIYYLDYGYTEMDPAQFPVDGAIRFYPWSWLNPANGVYNWTELDNWIAKRKALGLRTGMLITTYDGIASGDIRSTPDYVIETADAVLPVNVQDTTTPHYVPTWPYQRNYTYNADFDASDHGLGWTLTGNVVIVSNPPSDAARVANGWAAKLGGVNNASGSLYHFDQRFPAMPASLTGTVTTYIALRVYITTTDPNPNDHLYVELWDQNNTRIGSAQLDVNNKSQANNTWQDYSFNVSSVAPRRTARVAFRVVTDSANPSTFYVDNVSPMVRHLVPYYHGKTWAARKSSPYLDAYKTFIQALGEHLRDNPDMEFVALGTGVFSENQPAQPGA
jgi:hypothetical protein